MRVLLALSFGIFQKKFEIFLTLEITIQPFEAIQKAHPAEAEHDTAHPHESQVHRVYIVAKLDNMGFLMPRRCRSGTFNNVFIFIFLFQSE